MRFRCAFLGLTMALAALAAGAQTVAWSIRPSNFTDITKIGDDLYKVTRNGKIGLVYSDGTAAEDFEADEITDYYDGKALLIKQAAEGRQVIGCLSIQGNYRQFPKGKRFFSLKGQEFFSEGLLTVEDGDGRKGYINSDGAEVIGFDKGYKKIKPFSEGFAAVFKGEKYCLIDSEGREAKFTFPKGRSGSEVYGGTNVYEGVAYIWDDDGRFYTYDTQTRGELVKASKPSGDTFDYLFRLACLTGESKKVPFVVKSSHKGKVGLQPSVKDDLYGYYSGSYAVLPYQLTAASAFEDGYAVVSLYGKRGLLKLEPGSFRSSVLQGEIDFHEGDTVTCSFVVTMPSVWAAAEADVSLTDAGGLPVVLEKGGDGNYSFTLFPTESCSSDYSLLVTKEGLKLYEAALSYSLTKKVVCPTCGEDIDKCAYGGNHPEKKVTAPASKDNDKGDGDGASKSEEKEKQKKEKRFIHH